MAGQLLWVVGARQAAEAQAEGELREEAVTTLGRMSLFCLF